MFIKAHKSIKKNCNEKVLARKMTCTLAFDICLDLWPECKPYIILLNFATYEFALLLLFEILIEFANVGIC